MFPVTEAYRVEISSKSETSTRSLLTKAIVFGISTEVDDDSWIRVKISLDRQNSIEMLTHEKKPDKGDYLDTGEPEFELWKRSR